MVAFKDLKCHQCEAVTPIKLQDTYWILITDSSLRSCKLKMNPFSRRLLSFWTQYSAFRSELTMKLKERCITSTKTNKVNEMMANYGRLWQNPNPDHMITSVFIEHIYKLKI